MNRRRFVKNTALYSSLLLNGSFFSEYLFSDTAAFGLLKEDFEKPIDTKIRVQPICSARVHLEAYNGPCRWGKLENLTTEAERTTGHKKMDRFIKDLAANTPQEAVVLDPYFVEFPEGDTIDASFWKQLDSEVENIDLFLASYRVPGLERYKKPLAMIKKGITSVDVAAYYRTLGLEGYAPYNWEEFNQLVSLLKVRKAIAQTKILVLTNRINEKPYSIYSNITDLEHLNEKYGIECQAISHTEFFDELKKISENKKLQRRLKQLKDSLIHDAEAVHMQKDTIINDVAFYVTVNRLFEKYNANAFSVRCFELCGSKLPMKNKLVGCVALSLLKDQGIPAGCEGDMNALMAMIVEMYLAKKSVFMGNPYFEIDDNLIKIHHDVPGLKMKGFNEPDLPYEIVNFTSEGFGATIRYDFSLDKGEEVTLARFDPYGDKILVTTGTIDSCNRMREVGCQLEVSIKVKNARDGFEKTKDFGHHMVMVYGNYSEQIKRLGEILKFDVVEF